MPAYARWAIPVLLLLLLTRLVWYGVHAVLHPDRARLADSPAARALSASAAAALRAVAWQRDFMDSLDEGAREAGAGNITAAEVGVDRAESILTAARLESRDAAPDFFQSALSQLDRVLTPRPDDPRLFDHVTQARVSLAELRSSLAASAAPDAGRIAIGAPREIAPGQTLDPASLRGDFLDATLMPDTSEILLPPSTRAYADNIRVEDLTIAGAAQTLDGIRWRNVTFLGTRLRYEGGELDLHNLRFARCRFGIPSSARGARLASALSLGESSIAIDAPPPAPPPAPAPAPAP